MAVGRYERVPATSPTRHQNTVDVEADSQAEAKDDVALMAGVSDMQPGFLKPSPISKIITSPLWFFGFLCLLVVIIVLFVLQPVPILKAATAPNHTGMGSCMLGYATEFDDVQPALQRIEKRFTGAIRDDESGDLYFTWEDDEHHYSVSSGATWEDVDRSWEDLLYGRYVGLSPGEVDWLNKDPFIPRLQTLNSTDAPEGYYGGPDMLHSLHCLNSLRRALYKDHYHEEMAVDDFHRQMHNDHCIEQLRQALLCHGDMTPVTIKPVVKDGNVWAWLGETERPHTCRDGMKLREWWSDRGEQTGVLY